MIDYVEFVVGLVLVVGMGIIVTAIAYELGKASVEQAVCASRGFTAVYEVSDITYCLDAKTGRG